MFVERLNNKDAVELANWICGLSNDEVEKAKIVRNVSGISYFTFEGIAKKQYKFLVSDFELVGLGFNHSDSSQVLFTRYMTSKFGKEYKSAFIKHIDSDLDSYITK